MNANNMGDCDREYEIGLGLHQIEERTKCNKLKMYNCDSSRVGLPVECKIGRIHTHVDHMV